MRTRFQLRFRLLVALPALLALGWTPPAAAQPDRTMMQGFYWDVSPGGVWYDTLAHYAPLLQRAGFDAIWFPPPSKGAGGPFDVGYTPYDYYDLGEYDSGPGNQTSGVGNMIPTRYGTRAGLDRAIQAYKSRGMEVYADVVLNHRSGGLLEPNPYAQWYSVKRNDSTYTAFPLTYGSGRIAWPVGQGPAYFFPNGVRNPSNTGDFYSDSQLAGFHQMYVNSFGGDNALHNGDGSNLPLGDSLMAWGRWMVEEVGFDGFRFDFVKGMHPAYFKRFVDQTGVAGKYTVHELYDGSLDRLKTYLGQIGGTQRNGAVFDFSQRFAYKALSDAGNSYDIRAWHGTGLWTQSGVDWRRIATFVDNHDFDRLDHTNTVRIEGHSPVVNHKHLAYAHMLTHPGTATVWWRDYFKYGLRDRITRLVQIREAFVHGGAHILTAYTDPSGKWQAPFWPGNATEDPKHVYVAQRLGINDAGEQNTGLIVAINKHSGFRIGVWVTSQLWAGRDLKDITGNHSEIRRVQNDGRVYLETKAGEYGIWVPVEYTVASPFNLSLTAIGGIGEDLRVGDTVFPEVTIENRSLFSSQNVNIVFTIGEQYRDSVLVSRIEAGDRRVVRFDSFTFSEHTDSLFVNSRLEYTLDGDPTDNELSLYRSVQDTTTAYPFRVDGQRTESRYRTLALKQNTNFGFGAAKDVRAIRFADAPDTFYVFVDATMPLTDADGLGLVLDFSETPGVPAGTPIGGIAGAGHYLNAGNGANGRFTLDFEADHLFSLFGVQNGVPAMSHVMFTDGELSSRNVNTEGATRFFFRKTDGGWEIALPRTLIGVNGGEVRAFAFVVSSTGYFSNVLVPGDLTGTADAFGNIGFAADFTNREQTVHSTWWPVRGGAGDPDPDPEPEPVPVAPTVAPVTVGPTEATTADSINVVLNWHSVAGADRYEVQVSVFTTFSSNAFRSVLDDSSTVASGLAANRNHYWRVRAGNDGGWGPWSPRRSFRTPVVTSVDSGQMTGDSFELDPAYPNPFNPSTVVSYQLSVFGKTRLAVYDLLGREVAVLVDGVMPVGAHTVTFDGAGLSSGIYLIRLESGGEVAVRRVTLLK